MTVFDDLRDAFREAYDNFKRELHRDDVPDAVDRLLAGMREEATGARADVRRIQEDLKRSLAAAEAEKAEEERCRRREEMARRIGDEETAGIAADYAEKHARRRAVLEKKALALREEHRLREADVEEMVAKIKEAQKKRDSLAATAGRTGARESIGAADDLFAELDRMAEKIADDDRRGRAAEEITLDDLEAADDLDDLKLRMDDEPAPAMDVDARLAELKRRMGEE